MNNFRKLIVWQEAMSIAKHTYHVSNQLPDSERFGLINQMNRCSVSIASNIAEGAGRNHPKEFRQFSGIAMGGAYELETQLQLCVDLKFISEKSTNYLIKDLQRLERRLYKLRKVLVSKESYT